MARDLVFEIGLEELPAAYVPPALGELERALSRALSEARLEHASVRVLATPRRLSAIVGGVADEQEERKRIVTGPPAKIAYGADGAPTKAAAGFARSQGVDVADLEVVDDYVRVEVTDEGRPAAEVLPGCLAQAIGSIGFPKTMQWGPAERFARPIRWLVAILGDEVLDLEYAGVRASRETYGLRFWCEDPLEIAKAGDYERVLTDGRVILDHEARRESILGGLAAVAESGCGGRHVPDDDLLEEVTHLVECPTVFAGRFDERFLDLPRDVTVAAMKGHQRYFAVESEDGKLLPYFLCVSNTPPDHVEIIREGNERVLESRLDDAAFYWGEDTRTALADKVDSLRNVVWLEGLGSLHDKTDRIGRLSGWLVERLGEPDRDAVARAARLAKVDLVTEMVKDGKEFTELQGVMGREYALASGESKSVAAAIYEHYLPRFAGDDLPASRIGTILSIADKIDSIVGCFSAGLVPTGSQDPYALRRQAIGVVRMIDEGGLTLPLSDLVHEAARAHGIDDGTELAAGVLDFFRQRARVFYIDAGYAYDLVDAVLEASLDELSGVRPRLTALSHFRESEDFAGLVIGARRVMNILKGQAAHAYDAASLVEPSSRALEGARASAASAVEDAIGGGDFDRAVGELLKLRKPIDAFFDDVMVMVDDERVRNMRLGLLSGVRTLFLRIADFARVVLEGEERGEDRG
jgi:glycyl-tRNA synthetase beta chain